MTRFTQYSIDSVKKDKNGVSYSEYVYTWTMKWKRYCQCVVHRPYSWYTTAMCFVTYELRKCTDEGPFDLILHTCSKSDINVTLYDNCCLWWKQLIAGRMCRNSDIYIIPLNEIKHFHKQLSSAHHTNNVLADFLEIYYFYFHIYRNALNTSFCRLTSLFKVQREVVWTIYHTFWF